MLYDQGYGEQAILDLDNFWTGLWTCLRSWKSSSRLS
jgi:hypothetical protein